MPSKLAPLPPYARLIRHQGGSWRRACLHLLLRQSAKRHIGPGMNIARVRRMQAWLDRFLGRLNPTQGQAVPDGAGFTAEWLNLPHKPSRRVLLYLHGGAFLFRFPRAHAGLAAGWCRQLDAHALLVDYRLAPEHPYPAALDDCHAAYRYLLAQGYQSQEIVLAGDSAGGTLVLATLQRIRAAGEPMPACAVLLSPFVDFTLSSASLVSNERSDPMFNLASMVALRHLYAPPDAYLDPAVSPLFADYTGLPPMLIQVGDIEMLRDEALRLAAKADAAGVSVELEIWAGMSHLFQAMPTLPQARAANAAVVTYLRQRLGWHGP